MKNKIRCTMLAGLCILSLGIFSGCGSSSTSDSSSDSYDSTTDTGSDSYDSTDSDSDATTDTTDSTI